MAQSQQNFVIYVQLYGWYKLVIANGRTTHQNERTLGKWTALN
jgi:hypothetical protein